MMPRHSHHVAAWAAVLGLATADNMMVHPLARDAATCSNTSVTVPATLSGYAAASSSVRAILPSPQDWFSCGYTTCFNDAMSAWSTWEFGTMAAASTTSTSPHSTSASLSSSSSPSGALSTSRHLSSTTASSSGNVSSPNIVGRNGERGPFPSFSAVLSSCCSYCQVWVGNAEVLWWPGQTSAAPPGAASTTVYNGVTITSPTVYVAYTNPRAIDVCGYVGTGPTGGVVAVPTTDIKRLILPTAWKSPAFGGVTAVVTPSDFAGCESATQSQYNFTQTVDGTVAWGDKCFPTLLVPTQIVNVAPDWRSCIPGVFGMGDPPRALTVASMAPMTPAPNPPSQPSATPPAANTSPPPSAEAAQTPSPSTAAATPHTIPAAPAPPAPTTISVNSQVFTLDEVTTTDSRGVSQTLVGLVAAGTTVLAGHSLVSLNGEAVSLGSSELVVGSHTVTFDPSVIVNGVASSSSIHLGDVVMSGLGSIGGTSQLPINEANATSAAGGAMPTILTGGSSRILVPIWGRAFLLLAVVWWPVV